MFKLSELFTEHWTEIIDEKRADVNENSYALTLYNLYKNALQHTFKNYDRNNNMVRVSSTAVQTLLISSYGLSFSTAFTCIRQSGVCSTANLVQEQSAALSQSRLFMSSTKAGVDVKNMSMDEASANLIKSLEKQMEDMVIEDMDEECVLDPDTGMSADPELCEDPTKMSKFKKKMRGVVGKVITLVQSSDSDIIDQDIDDFDDEPVLEGELLEQGWETVSIASIIVIVLF